MNWKICGLVAAVSINWACSNEVADSGGAGGEGGSGGTPNSADGDGDDGASTGGTAAVEEADTCGPKATTSDQGILTPYPNIEVTLLPEGEFALESLNFTIEEDGDERGPLLTMFAEMRNTSSEAKCRMLPDVYMDGWEIITMVKAEPYHSVFLDTVASTVDMCIQPGETGILVGVQRGITESDLAEATFLSITPDAYDYDDEYVRASAPSVEGEPKKTSDGYVLAGSIEYGQSIYNQAVYVYPRDARGLIVDEVVAYPGNLENHYAGTTEEFETEATSCKFIDYEVYQTWIVND